MDRYILRVVDGDADADRSKTETVLADVDRLFREICRNIVRAELRLQGDVPDGLLPRSGPFGEGALCSDARRFMDETLNYLGGPSSGTWMDDTFPDVPGRRRIARIVLDISDGLGGSELVHGYEGSERRFSGSDVVRVSGIANAAMRAHEGGLVGVVMKDRGRFDSWHITNGRESVPIRFIPTVPQYTRDDFCSAGLVIAMGTVIRSDDGSVQELRAVENCYTFPGALFLRAISEGCDLGLVSPLEGVPGFYARTGTWHMRSPDLGLESSAGCWDDCVIGFHRRFVELWKAHRDGTAEENPRVHRLLDGMCPFPTDGSGTPAPASGR